MMSRSPFITSSPPPPPPPSPLSTIISATSLILPYFFSSFSFSTYPLPLRASFLTFLIHAKIPPAPRFIILIMHLHHAPFAGFSHFYTSFISEGAEEFFSAMRKKTRDGDGEERERNRGRKGKKKVKVGGKKEKREEKTLFFPQFHSFSRSAFTTFPSFLSMSARDEVFLFWAVSYIYTQPVFPCRCR
jgi:hypothetical protein